MLALLEALLSELQDTPVQFVDRLGAEVSPAVADACINSQEQSPIGMLSGVRLLRFLELRSEKSILSKRTVPILLGLVSLEHLECLR